MPDITKSKDGTWTWVYEQDLYHNRIMLATANKIMLAICLSLALVMGALIIVGQRQWDKLPLFILIVVLGTLGFLALSTVVYYLFAASQGGRRATAFEMDAMGVSYRALPPRAEDVNALTVLGEAADIASFSPASRAVDAYATQRIDFRKVRRVRPDPKHDAIKVSTLLVHHQVYASGADFERILGFIREHTG